MNRVQTILSLIEARGYKRYLEIGCDDDTTFSQVQIEKVGVDPVRGGTHRMTSDAFFAIVGEARFDIIFIDGDHRHDQALRDVENALSVLSLGGCIVMHDCLPPDEHHEAPFLCGTVWRAFVKLRARPDLDCVVGDYDYGVGIVRRGLNPAPINVPQSMASMTYQQFAKNRASWMRPIGFEDVRALASTVTPSGGTGLTSELSCRLHAAAAYHREHGRLPTVIDSRDQFWLYRDSPEQNVASRLFAEIRQVDVPRTDFNHGWCFGWCDTMDLENLARMAQAACAPSQEVADLAQKFTDFIENRTAVVYRGNDKVKDSPLVEYDAMVEMARDTGSERFIVQTDEVDFFEHFSKRFPDTVHFGNFPMIRRNPNAYVLPSVGKRVQFAVEFFAAITALARAPQLLIVTGNIGLWCALFRGNTNNLWQADGAEKRWKRLDGGHR